MRRLSLISKVSEKPGLLGFLPQATGKKMAKSLFLIMCFAFAGFGAMAQAESLFSLNASQQANYIEPKPLFGTARARGIGDLVTILITETPTITDKASYQTEKSSSILENIANTVNRVLDTDLKSVDGTNGSIDVQGGTNTQRQLSFKDSVAVQVVQVMPNGNLLVQGKKTLLSQNERMDLLVSGIVDPRLINQQGQINSRSVANLQFAATGAGTVSRGQNEGFFTRFFRMIF